MLLDTQNPVLKGHCVGVEKERKRERERRQAQKKY